MTSLVAFTAAVTAVVAGASPATEAVRPWTGAHSGVRVYTSPRLPFNGETWTQRTAWAGYSGQSVYSDVKTGRCIDDSTRYRLRSYGYNGQIFQSWTESYNASDGTWTLKSGSTGWCIDDSTAYHPRSYPCNGLDFQHWYEYLVSFDGERDDRLVHLREQEDQRLHR